MQTNMAVFNSKILFASASELDLWVDDEDSMPRMASTSARSAVLSRSAKGGPRPLTTKVKAVEVDMAGCSYNPEPEAHQVGLE